MTVAELCARMDSRELSEWMAFHRFFMPLPDSWHQTGVLAAATISPHTRRGHVPKVADFVPIEKPPQHYLQDQAAIEELRRQLRGE